MADDAGLVSVLVPCCGQLEHTRLSLPRVLRHSRPPVEVLCLDAYSLDGTREYLEGIAAASPVRVEVLRSDEEDGFAALVAQALAKSRGRLVAWVGNDVLVTALWLQHLSGLLAMDARIGVACPVSNLAGKPLRVADVPYRLAAPQGGAGGTGLDTAAVDAFAAQVREAGQGQWSQVEQAGGFCWLARREALDKALSGGEAAEAVQDEGKFSTAVRKAGFQIACCRDLYVHHFGSNLLAT